MVEIYSEVMSTRNYKRDTIRRKLQHIRHYLKWTADKDDLISSHRLLERYVCYLAKEGAAEKTIRNRLSSLKGFFDYLLFHGYIKESPIDPTRRIKLPETVPVFLPDDEVQLLLDLAKKVDILTEVVVALNTGLRMNELRHLKWKDIDFDSRQLIVQGRYAKGKRPRVVPLNQRAIEALTKQKHLYKKFCYVFPGGKGGFYARNVWNKDCVRSYKWWLRLSLDPIRDQVPTIANLPKCVTGRGWHIMRHTFATRLARAGVDIVKIKDWLGHKSINTTLRYVHLARHYDEDIELITV